ncbi:MAG: ChaN family lipoprotein [Rubricoccaceae bacterium]
MLALRPLVLAAALLTALAPQIAAQPVYHADGRPAPWNAIAEAAADADVLVLGEIHDDSLGHALKARLLAELLMRHGPARPLALALEMFETDVQLVLDEYLGDTVRERDFLAASRPWGNYARDYRPLVEQAREAGLPVLAANAPARYVNLTSRAGPDALEALSPEARALLPPLPVAPASEALAEAFRAVMAGLGAAHGAHGPHGGPSLDGMLAAQNLRDASMAYVVAQHLAQTPGALVVHVNGAFHSDFGRGVPEHLARYAPAARLITVSFVPETAWSDAHAGRADFVVLTR